MFHSPQSQYSGTSDNQLPNSGKLLIMNLFLLFDMYIPINKENLRIIKWNWLTHYFRYSEVPHYVNPSSLYQLSNSETPLLFPCNIIAYPSTIFVPLNKDNLRIMKNVALPILSLFRGSTLYMYVHWSILLPISSGGLLQSTGSGRTGGDCHGDWRDQTLCVGIWWRPVHWGWPGEGTSLSDQLPVCPCLSSHWCNTRWMNQCTHVWGWPSERSSLSD